MACPIFPATITAGLTFKATAFLADYPAPDWTITAIIRGKQDINLTATADGTAHVLEVPAATTADWLPGAYAFSVRASDGTDVHEIEAGRLEVLPDLAAITGDHEARSQNEIALAAIEAVLARRATLDQERYTINNRELWRTPIADLLKLRSFYQNAVAREKAKASGRSTFGRKIIVRFS